MASTVLRYGKFVDALNKAAYQEHGVVVVFLYPASALQGLRGRLPFVATPTLLTMLRDLAVNRTTFPIPKRRALP